MGLGGLKTGKMAEIKSAIELAMEKTKNLVIDSKEREEMAVKEIEDKVKAVIRRFMEEMIDHVDSELVRSDVVQLGDQVVLVCGFPVGAIRPPNMALLHTVGES